MGSAERRGPSVIMDGERVGVRVGEGGEGRGDWEREHLRGGGRCRHRAQGGFGPDSGKGKGAMTGTERPGYDLEQWRRQIQLLDKLIPLNNCSQAPQTERTLAAAEAFLESWGRDGMDWDRWLEEVEGAKAEFARLINALPDEIAVTTSVSAATAGVAGAIGFEGGRRKVVVTEAEFPTVGHVWLAQQRLGATVEWVPVRDGMVDPAAFDEAVDERTRVVSACHGYYQNGFRQDVAAIAERAHACGAWLFVDAYQTAGTCAVDVKALGVDFLASGTLKYLMGTAGIAFLYIRPELIEQLKPVVTGWFGRAEPFAFDVRTLDWSASARRFETGTPPVVNAYIARAGLAMINEIGPAAIEAWSDRLSRRLLEGGRARGLTVHGTTDLRRKTASTAFLCPGDSHAVEARLRERGVLASARGPVIRLAPHFYNTLEEMDAALDALAGILESAP